MKYTLKSARIATNEQPEIITIKVGKVEGMGASTLFLSPKNAVTELNFPVN